MDNSELFEEIFYEGDCKVLLQPKCDTWLRIVVKKWDDLDSEGSVKASGYSITTIAIIDSPRLTFDVEDDFIGWNWWYEEDGIHAVVEKHGREIYEQAIRFMISKIKLLSNVVYDMQDQISWVGSPAERKDNHGRREEEPGTHGGCDQVQRSHQADLRNARSHGR